MEEPFDEHEIAKGLRIGVRSGEIRPVGQVDRRVQEAARLGYKRIFVSSFAKVEVQPEGIRVVKVADVPALVKALFK